MARLFRFLMGLVLLPLCVAVTWATLRMLREIRGAGSIFSQESACLIGGYGAWLLIWFFLSQPVRAYILAHELTHALWALAFGGGVKNLKVTAKGGSVRVTKSNVWITLAPYFFPFYTLLVILIHGCIGWFVSPVPYPLAWLFLVGFTWAFHFTFTIQSLTIQQPDIEEYGRLFSYTFIYLFNLFGIGLWIVCTTEATFMGLLREWGSLAGTVYVWVAHQLAEGWTAGMTFVRERWNR